MQTLPTRLVRWPHECCAARLSEIRPHWVVEVKKTVGGFHGPRTQIRTAAMSLIQMIPKKGAGNAPCVMIGYIVTAPRALTRTIRTLPTSLAGTPPVCSAARDKSDSLHGRFGPPPFYELKIHTV